MNKRLIALAVVASTLFYGQAFASGFLVARFGGEFGHPTTDNLTAMYYNPAGISLLEGTQLYVDGAIAWRSFNYDRDPGAIDQILDDPSTGTGTPSGAGVAANSGEGTLFNIVASPFIGFGSDFGVEGFGAAVGFYTPFGGSSSYDQVDVDDDYPWAADGSQRWWVIEGTIRTSYITAALAYEIPDVRLSFGASANVALSTVDTIRARNSSGRDDMTSNGNIQEGRGLLEMSGVDIAMGFGLMWQPIDGLFIGASYQSQPAFGEMELDGEVTLRLGSGTGEATVSDAIFRQSLPDVIRFGARYLREKSWEVRLFGEVARWSELEYQCVLGKQGDENRCDLDNPSDNKILIIPRKWEDAFSIRGGGSLWVSPEVELYLGAGYDGNAVPDNVVEPSLYDTDKISVALGARFSLLDDALFIIAGYTQVIYFDREIAPRGRIATGNGGTASDFEGAVGASNDVRQPDAAGTYKQAIGLLTLGVGYNF